MKYVITQLCLGVDLEQTDAGWVFRTGDRVRGPFRSEKEALDNVKRAVREILAPLFEVAQ